MAQRSLDIQGSFRLSQCEIIHKVTKFNYNNLNRFLYQMIIIAVNKTNSNVRKTTQGYCLGISILLGIFLYPLQVKALDSRLDLRFFNTGSGGSDKLFFIGAGVVLLLLALLVVLNRWYHKRKFKQSGVELQKRQTVVKLQNKDLSPESIQVIQGLSKATNIKTELLLSYNRTFEDSVKQLKQISPSNPLLERIQSLREELGFIYLNRSAEFICSQMLLPGQKVRVALKAKGKQLSFATTILHSTEEEFWIKPPMSKGKPVNLSVLKKMEFRVFRKNDGEYSFEAPLKTQVEKPMHAIIMLQTNEIQKWKTREDDRFDMKFERVFFVTSMQTQPDAEKATLTTISLTGVVVDISIGGLRFIYDELPYPIPVGSSVMFQLPEANIKKDILTKIVRFSTEKNTKYIHIQFNELTELNRLNIQKFIENQKAKKIDDYK